MKKILILILISACSFSRPFFSTTWAGTAMNQTISYNAMTDGCSNYIFGLLFWSFTAPSGDQSRGITKSVFLSNVTTSNFYANSVYMAKTSLELLTKRDINISLTGCSTGYADAFTAWSSGCSVSATTYYISADAKVYTNSAMTTLFAGNSLYYKCQPNSGCFVIQVDNSGNLLWYGNPC